MATTTATEPEELLQQRRLVEKLEASGGWDIIVGDAFVRGMRDIGYKSSSYALAEIIDNSVEAAARHVDVVFGFSTGKTPTQLAVIDDGYGMEPKMVRAALIWGAGTRAERRTGWGKYGYGLPSASVSQCQRVTVYSKTAGGSWHSCYLDIEEISKGDPGWLKGNRLEMPQEQADVPPAFVIHFLKTARRWDNFDHGTVVLWDKLDRINPKQRDTLRNRFISDVGVVYRNKLVDVPMTVDGERVQPCDPLFLTPGFRGYDTDEDQATALEPALVDVTDKDSGAVIGKLRLRFSVMPATFFRKPEYKRTNRPGRGGTNERLEIASANDGIIFCRDGRQIDHIRPPRSFGSINVTTDRFWAIEVDFDNTLDELFRITTSKQQVDPDERIWNILRDKANLFAAIGTMRTRYEREAKAIVAHADTSGTGQRASITALEEAEKFRTTPVPTETQERIDEAEQNLETEAKRRAEQAGVGTEVVRREIEAQQQGNPRDVRTEEMPGGPFFRAVPLGYQRVLYLNVAHPFYTELYSGPGSSPRLRAGLEILLWTLGDAEIDADPNSEKRLFYELERSQVWSPRLAAALTQLRAMPLMELPDDPADDEVDRTTAA